MGPREILGLIEEASGTRMYEEKKEKALRTISKKEKKVEDIESVSFFIYGAIIGGRNKAPGMQVSSKAGGAILRRIQLCPPGGTRV